MSLETAYAAYRAGLITAVKAPWEAAFPGEPIVFDNEPFNWDDPPERFSVFEINFYGASQIGLSADPKTRTRGYVYFTSYIRRGLGSAIPVMRIGWMADLLKYRTIAGLQLQEPEPDGGRPPQRWHTEGLKIGFFSAPA